MKKAPFSKTSLLSAYRAASLIIFFILLFIVIQLNAEEKKEHTGVEIAFLEDWCSRYSEGREVKIKYKPRVRLAFRFTKDGWKKFGNRVSGIKELKQAADRFKGNRSWFMLERDKPLDSLLSKGVDEYQLYCDVGTQNIVGQVTSTALLPRTMEFSGWHHCEVRKPIVLVSRKPSKSRDNWVRIKPTYTPDNETVKLINEYGSQLYSCKDERDENGSSLKAKISVEMLKTVDEIVSEKGDRLLAVAFRDDACVLDNTGDKVSSWYWFSQIGNTRVIFIGEGLKLIDWADYDADGNSEFIFWLNGYNLNGYRILWSKLPRTTTVSWKYH